jgi:hypothetical protein
MLAQTVDGIASMLVEVRRIQDAQIDMMLAAERRDKVAAKRDTVMLTALEARNDVIDFLRKEAKTHESAGKTRRAPSGKRTAHGRTNRKKP